MINDALDISRLENNKFEINKALFNIRDAVNDVQDIMRFQLVAKGLGFKLNIASQSPRSLTQIKEDQASAFQLDWERGEVHFLGGVSVDLKYEDLTQVITGTVRDTGVGIKREDLTKLFKFFGKISSTKDINKSGMGLGLTISKMIIEQFGGEIDVETREGLGSKFSSRYLYSSFFV